MNVCKSALVTLSSLFFFHSCAWNLAQNKKYYFREVKENIGALPEQLSQGCYPSLDQLEIPETRECASKDPGFASYNPQERLVVIAPGYYSNLAHEYQHFFNHNGNGGHPVSWMCLDQLTSYQAERIIILEDKIARLKQQNFAAGARKKY